MNEHSGIPDFVSAPRMDISDSIYYRHYRITRHAAERYLERIGGDVGNMLLDLNGAVLFESCRKRTPHKLRVSVIRCEQEGGYALINGKAIFLVKPDNRRHTIVTTLRME